MPRSAQRNAEPSSRGRCCCSRRRGTFEAIYMGSLALRPSGSLTIHEMALSIGFRIFSFRPSCYSSYGASNFYPGGTFTHCSCQPSLDAHLSFLIAWKLLLSALCMALRLGSKIGGRCSPHFPLVPEYIGADLTDRYSAQCRDSDVCGPRPA
jgi:hypothetical protein